MTRNIHSDSEEETLQLGIELGRESRPGDIYALSGELGAGKTIIAKGIAIGLGINEDILSPTYTLMEIYKGRKMLYHFDLYRIGNTGELDVLNFEEYWYGDGISVIEWADKAKDRLKDNTINIDIKYVNENCRRITIEYPDD